MRVLIVFVLALASVTPLHADGLANRDALVQQARDAAARHDCETFFNLMGQLQQRDPVYYIDVAGDPTMVCKPPPAPVLVAPAVATTPMIAPDPAAPRRRRSRLLATTLSLAVTAGGAWLAIVGVEEGNRSAIVGGAALFAVGPTTGHVYYAGRVHWRLLAVRAAMIGTGAMGAAMGAQPLEVGGVVVLVSATVSMFAMLCEITTWPSAARTNARLVPAPIATAHGTSPGVAVLGRF